jgi:peptide chain release factor 2
MQEIESKMSLPGFWDDQQEANRLAREMSIVKSKITLLDDIEAKLGDCVAAASMAEEDKEFLVEAESILHELEKEVRELELETLLSGEYDFNNAIISLHPGAGGLESQDWAQMLMRMYTRWADTRGYKVEIVDLQPCDEGGIKSATLIISGPWAYGFLRAEKGVHRLVRISPFDASGRRHTSFASMDVTPEITDDAIEVEIRPDDLQVDTFRASGAGGQHVNKTDSAVRMTHLPTGIVVACQNQRSQIANRDTAMRILKAKLYEVELRKREERMAEHKDENKEIGWGSQIRSYVFHPYSMAKDHRTSYEVGNVYAVMDGDIDGFIYAWLASRIKR